jgi:hypothetical protein
MLTKRQIIILKLLYHSKNGRIIVSNHYLNCYVWVAIKPPKIFNCDKCSNEYVFTIRKDTFDALRFEGYLYRLDRPMIDEDIFTYQISGKGKEYLKENHGKL